MRRFIDRIGFMQGRLSPLIDGKIQAFPWQNWQQEIELAALHGFNFMEWTLDQDRLYENPLMTRDGRDKLKTLISKYKVSVPSLTGDCFMQAPFYKVEGCERDLLLRDLVEIIKASARLGIKSVLIPLVDDGRIENIEQEDNIVSELKNLTKFLEKSEIKISFESDYNPRRLADFIKRFDAKHFGITYDIGNSAALGYNPVEEIRAYGSRVVNVHVKDRILGGNTVPLGAGAADIPKVFHELLNSGYSGNFILQTARADNGNHVGVLCDYRDKVACWLEETVID